MNNKKYIVINNNGLPFIKNQYFEYILRINKDNSIDGISYKLHNKVTFCRFVKFNTFHYVNYEELKTTYSYYKFTLLTEEEFLFKYFEHLFIKNN